MINFQLNFFRVDRCFFRFRSTEARGETIAEGIEYVLPLEMLCIGSRYGVFNL